MKYTWILSLILCGTAAGQGKLTQADFPLDLKIVAAEVHTETTGANISRPPGCTYPATPTMEGFCSSMGSQMRNVRRSYAVMTAEAGDTLYLLTAKNMLKPGVWMARLKDGRVEVASWTDKDKFQIRKLDIVGMRLTAP